MGAAMNKISTTIKDVILIEFDKHNDTRGSFARLYCERELSDILGSRRILQINYSRTVATGALRGMHYQKQPCAEMKFVRCLKGRIWDVAVDLRANSPTFLNWHAEELSAVNARMMVVPEGCAHGYQVLEGEVELLYLHTAFYAPEAERALRHDDPMLGITWPLSVRDLSPRDANQPFITSAFQGELL